MPRDTIPGPDKTKSRKVNEGVVKTGGCRGQQIHVVNVDCLLTIRLSWVWVYGRERVKILDLDILKS